MHAEVEKGVAFIQTIINRMVEFLVDYSFEVLGAVLVLVIGAFVSRWAGKMLQRFFHRRHFDPTLSGFAVAAVRGGIMGFALIVALGKFGITIAPIIAAFSALVFGGTFALQGPLSNFAAGLTLLLTRPFTVGNTISVAGVSGVVDEIKLGATVLSSLDGERITIPNKHIIGEILKNSAEHHVVDTTIGISYEDDPERAIALIRGILDADSEIAKTPPPIVGIKEFGESSINLGVRYWVPTRQFFPVSYATNLAIWKGLRAAGITIPFPQRDVRIVSQPDAVR